MTPSLSVNGLIFTLNWSIIKGQIMNKSIVQFAIPKGKTNAKTSTCH